MQWSTLHYLKRTRLTRVPRTPGLGPIRIAESGIEGGKCDSVCHTNQVRDLVALWCLPARKELGKWVRQPPLANPKSQLSYVLEGGSTASCKPHG